MLLLGRSGQPSFVCGELRVESYVVSWYSATTFIDDIVSVFD